MKIHVVVFTSTPHDHANGGFSFYSSKRKAEAEIRQAIKNGYKAERRLIEVQPTKRGIIKALNIHASHPDNG